MGRKRDTTCAECTVTNNNYLRCHHDISLSDGERRAACHILPWVSASATHTHTTVLFTVLTYTVTVRELEDVPQPPWTYCENPGDIGARIRKERANSGCLVCQLRLLEGRPGLDPRVGEGVKPELFSCEPQQHRRNHGVYCGLTGEVEVRIL